MGYTHYWRRIKELDVEKFNKVVEDCRVIVQKVRSIGIPLAGWNGSGEPEITSESIKFNGLTDCGHDRRDLGITWPSDDASGIGTQQEQGDGKWFSGATLQHRSCGGDCSHESFSLPRIYDGSNQDKDLRYFDCTKTAYKPYDLAVIMCLLVAKHHLGDDIQLSSDGTEAQWSDGCHGVRQIFGYEVLAPR